MLIPRPLHTGRGSTQGTRPPQLSCPAPTPEPALSCLLHFSCPKENKQGTEGKKPQLRLQQGLWIS